MVPEGGWECYGGQGAQQPPPTVRPVPPTTVIPQVKGQLKTHHDNLCLDYNYRTHNVYMHSCHGDPWQQWHINADGSMGTAHDDKCLDYNYRTMNVYNSSTHNKTLQT